MVFEAKNQCLLHKKWISVRNSVRIDIGNYSTNLPWDIGIIEMATKLVAIIPKQNVMEVVTPCFQIMCAKIR